MSTHVPTIRSKARRRKASRKAKRRHIVTQAYPELEVGEEYFRAGIVPLDEGLRAIASDEDRVMFGPHQVKVMSLRLRTFASCGPDCVSCSLKGTHFALEVDYTMAASAVSAQKPIPFHLNLYGLDEEGNEVLMTHDHIRPRSKGGANILRNTQTMCKPCNEAKSDRWEGN